MGCRRRCSRCVGATPCGSLLATVVCLAGVGLFCGAGHQALGATEELLRHRFAYPTDDGGEDGERRGIGKLMDVLRYVLYGLAGAFCLYGAVLLCEGAASTRARRRSYSGGSGASACATCVSGWFILLTFVLALAWLGVFGLSALPVYMAASVLSACHSVTPPAGSPAPPAPSRVCVDLRQFGVIPWNETAGVLCDTPLSDMCDSSEFTTAFYLYAAASAGAALTVLSMLIYCSVLVYNFGVSRLYRREDYCTKL
ncbi:unnamed protein product [Lampetra planeri]